MLVVMLSSESKGSVIETSSSYDLMVFVEYDKGYEGPKLIGGDTFRGVR